MRRIEVHVTKRQGSKFWQARWTDPETERRKWMSTGCVKKQDAERFAARLANDLNDGKDVTRYSMAWEEFRDRYETEVLAGLAAKTAAKAGSVFNQLEEAVAPARLRQVNENAISKFTKHLRGKGSAESTIKGHLAHLRAALAWAKRMKLIPRVPEITMPKRAKSGRVMKGRPITTEEFERMLAKVPSIVGRRWQAQRRQIHRRLSSLRAAGARAEIAELRIRLIAGRRAFREAVEAWRFFLRGLWWSGLRLGEALELWWDRDDMLSVDLSGNRPMIRIRAEGEKGHQDRLLPMAPEFAELLDTVAGADRAGRVFKLPVFQEGAERLRLDTASKLIQAIGEAAKVKVETKRLKTDPPSVRVRYAGAHDLRRSFGERWAMLVMPHVLKELMRHASIETTMRYYVGRNAQTAADAIWNARSAPNGSTCGSAGPISSPSGGS